jgi:hypothetical protein
MGLLEGVGYALAGGLAGAGKAGQDVFAEQMKQTALEAREVNMLRIQNLFAKEGRAETFKFQGEQTEKQIKAARDLEADRQAAQVSLHDSSEEGATRRAEEAQNQESMRQDVSIAAQKDLAKLTAELDNKKKDAVTKNYEALSNIFGKDQAKTIITAGLTKEINEEKRTKLKAWVDLYVSDMKILGAGGITPTPQQKQEVSFGVTTALGYSPLDLIPKTGTSVEKPAAAGASARERAIAEAAAKTGAAAGGGENAVKPGTGLIEGQTRNPLPGINTESDIGRNILLNQRNAGRLKSYDENRNALLAQGKSEGEILKLIGRRPAQ